MLGQAEYTDYCLRFKNVWQYLYDTSFEVGSVIEEICELRKYDADGQMPAMLNRIGFVYSNPEQFSSERLKRLDDGSLGLYSDKGEFILKDRFIFPVKDMLGNIIALIGWLPDEKKYITTPSKLFSKKCLLFGLEQLKRTGIGKNYFLVEGIFDCISVRSLGLNCVALMGITATQYTEVLYSLFRRLVAIPDNDKEGRKVVQEDKWHLPNNSSYFRWSGKLKDVDDIISRYDVSKTLSNLFLRKDRIITSEVRYD